MEWSLSVVGSGRVLNPLNGVSGVYSEDGRHFIVVLSHHIRVYFMNTRQCIRSIPVDIDLENLTGLVIQGSEVVMALNQKIVTVNWKDKLLDPIIARQEVGFHISSIFNHDGIVLIGEDNGLAMSKLHGQDRIDQLIELPCQKYAMSNNHHYLLVLNHNQLTTYNLDTKEITKGSFTYKSPITSLAISDDGLVALGSNAGPIQIIFPDGQEKILKWHIGAVKSLIFGNNSNQLISGGLEKVLVIWSIINDKLQFLPRLNGTIENIFIDDNKLDNYNIVLGINHGFEILVISSVDLISRLSINSPRPNKISNKNNIIPVCEVFNHNNLYLTNDSILQNFNIDKYEQLSLTNLSENIGIGKVKSELKLNDPVITQLKFLNNEWMCTFDKLIGDNDLLSKDDINYALKFWKNTSNNGTNGENVEKWDLITKVINPHNNLPIINIKPFQDGFITVDNKCNLRYWKFKKGQWSLIKNKLMNLNETKFINIEISNDNSLIIVSYENKIFCLGNNFNKLDNINLNLSDSNIRSIKIIDDQLIVLSKTRILSFNLIEFNITSQFAIPEKFPIGGDHLVATNGTYLILAIQSVILLLDKVLSPVFITKHNRKILNIKPYQNSFLFIDDSKNIGIISNNSLDLVTKDDGEIEEVKEFKINNGVNGDVTEDLQLKVFDSNSFIFDTDNLETLFDKIIKVVNN